MNLSPLIMRIGSNRLRSFVLRKLGENGLNQGTLPDFIIIGAQKAGTTSLHGYLRQHPDVLPSAHKEIHYFDGRRYVRGDDWYRRQFLDPEDLKGIGKLNGRRLISGEATPYYLFHPQVPGRIFKTAPDVKLIALLRDPVARAYSHYRHNVRVKKEPLSFSEALKREDEILPEEHARILSEPTYRSEAHHRFSYKLRGCYSEQIERYHRLFPKEQLLIVKAEDLFQEPRETYAQILKFLELRPHVVGSVQPLNAGGYAGEEIPQEQELRRFFKPHNQRLYELIGRDMGW